MKKSCEMNKYHKNILYLHSGDCPCMDFCPRHVKIKRRYVFFLYVKSVGNFTHVSKKMA